MKTVLFVCVHNSGRSQMAEAMLNDAAKKAGLTIRAKSAGTVGGKAINPMAVTAMAELGISMVGHHPKVLSQQMVDEADRIITMGCGVDTAACPSRFLASDDWNLDDPAGQSIEQVRQIRDEIRLKVDALLAQEAGSS